MAYAWLLTQSMKLHTISIPHIKRTSAVIDPTDLIFFSWISPFYISHDFSIQFIWKQFSKIAIWYEMYLIDKLVARFGHIRLSSGGR